MNEAVNKALELIEKGAAQIGTYGPELWARMVTYHLWLTVAEYGAAVASLSAIGYTLYRVARWFNAMTRPADWQEAVAAVVGLFGGITAVVLLAVVLVNFASVVATIAAPDVSLIFKLLKGTITN